MAMKEVVNGMGSIMQVDNLFICEIQQDQTVSNILQRFSEAVKELSNEIPRDKDVEELKVKYSGDAGTKTAGHLGRQR